MILLYLNVLCYLTPFLHAWLLLSLIKKTESNESLWTAMQNLIHAYHNSVAEFEHLLQGNFIVKEPELMKSSPVIKSIDASILLGQDSF
ncbi:unnamed protein product [Heterobilharzia americana]|nr:unnamed protein product [Heterobilharzia americana]